MQQVAKDLGEELVIAEPPLFAVKGNDEALFVRAAR